MADTVDDLRDGPRFQIVDEPPEPRTMTAEEAVAFLARLVPPVGTPTTITSEEA